MSSNPQVTAVISAEDRASPVLRAIAKIAQETAKQMEKGHGEALSSLPKNLNLANVAAERNIALLSRMKEVMSGVATAAAAYAGHLAQAASKAIGHEGMRLQAESQKLVRAGIPDSEIDGRRTGRGTRKGLRPVGRHRAGNLRLRSVIQDLHEVPHLLKPTLEAAAQMKANGVNTEGLVYAVKAAELLGRAADPEKFKSTLGAVVAAQQVMGKTIRPETMFDLAKYSKSSGGLLSERFLFTTAFSLSQEMGGSSAGNALDQWNKLTSGGLQNLHTAAKEWARLGLVKPEDLDHLKNGEVKGLKPGRDIIGAKLARSDPDKYYYQHMKPALEKAGYKTYEERAAEIRRLAPNKNAADLLVKLDQQQTAFENHAKLYKNALGMNADLSKNAAVQLDAFNTTLKDVGAQLGEPMMKPFAEFLHGLSARLRDVMPSYDGFAKNNPNLAAGIGAAITAGLKGGGIVLEGGAAWIVLKKLLGDAGLKGSAVALDGSAAALTRAAVALGAAGKLPGVLSGAGGAVAGGAVAEGAATLASVGTISIGTLGTIALGAGSAAAFGYLVKEAADAFKMLYNREHRPGTPLAPEHQVPGYDPVAGEWWRTYGREQSKFGFSPSESIGKAWDEIQSRQAQIAEHEREVGKIDKTTPQNGSQANALADMRRRRQTIIDGLKAQVEQLQAHIDAMGDVINGSNPLDALDPKRKGNVKKAVRDAAGLPDNPPEPPRRPADLSPPAGGLPTFARPSEGGSFGSLLSAINALNSKPVKVETTPLQGTLTGSATLGVNISPSPLFIAKMDEVRAIAVSAKVAAHGAAPALGGSLSGPTGVQK